jgi:16S rRNA processing protein RimM
MTVGAEVAPADLVLVGHVVDAWRLDGSVKVAPYSNDAGALLAARSWWLDVRGQVRSFDVHAAKSHGSHVTASLVGIVDRDAAEKLKGARISVQRRSFPVTDDDEYYWVDLIGLAVQNEAGEALGAVADLIDNGAHQVLVVREVVARAVAEPAAAAAEQTKPTERLIPFVDAYVKSVELANRKIVVDWQKDY